MKTWSDVEVKSLFERVEKCKHENVALIRAFAEHAKKFSRKQNSVRNYYYHEVDNLCGDLARAAELKIDLKKHQKVHFKNFDKVQEGDLFGEIDKLTKAGLSVRAACLKLSGGDLALMTRFQNKYQNMKRKIDSSEKFKNIMQTNQKTAKNGANSTKILYNQDFSVQENEKIIPFKIPHNLSDADINSLFLGLVRLVKKSAQEEFSEQSREMKKMFEKKESELENLRLEFEKLRTENLSLHLQIEKISRSNRKMGLEKHLTHQRDKNVYDLEKG